MDLDTFRRKVASYDGHLRRGQYAFNLLCVNRADLSEQIRGESEGRDPFYRDENLEQFWAWLEEAWDAR